MNRLQISDVQQHQYRPGGVAQQRKDVGQRAVHREEPQGLQSEAKVEVNTGVEVVLMLAEDGGQQAGGAVHRRDGDNDQVEEDVLRKKGESRKTTSR